MTKSVTKREIEATILMVRAVADAIRDLGEVPAGHVYAHLMGHMSLDTFEKIIATLVNAGLVKRDGFHMLTWIGPKLEPTTEGA